MYGDPSNEVCSSANDEGRVEIYHDGEWGTVCDDYWGIDEARAVCHQLGFRDALYHWTGAWFGRGSEEKPIWMDDVSCSRQAMRLDQCTFSQGWGVSNCAHDEDAAVSCDPMSDPPHPPNPPPEPPMAPLHDGDLRLRDGYRFAQDGVTALDGRLEVYHCSDSWDGTRECAWGTICDDDFGREEADVACRQMNLGAAKRWQGSARYGEGRGLIWMDDLGCTGDEARLGDCRTTTMWGELQPLEWGVNDCSHAEDAGVVCLGTDFPPAPPARPPSPPSNPMSEGDVRLVNGPTAHSGRIEIYHQGEWGSVCDDGWGPNEARAVCRQLGYNDAAPYESESTYGSYGTGGISYGISYGSYGTGTGGTYSTYTYDFPPLTPSPPPPPRPPPPHRDTGGTAQEYGKLHYGRGDGRIWLDDVSCREGTNRLDECDARTWGETDCMHNEDVGVRCVGHRAPDPPRPPPSPPRSPEHEGQIRLAGGSTKWQGRVEILHAGVWGTVCDDHWTQAEAEAVCRQLGHTGGIAVAGRGLDARFFGAGQGPIWLDEVACPTDFPLSSLSSCSHDQWGRSDCDHNEDAGVICSPSDGWSWRQSPVPC